MGDSELKQILKENLYLLSPEERLAGLTPEELERLKKEILSPEERLAGLTPEERLAGLTPEERLAGLTPEERLAGLTPEELEQLKKNIERKLQEQSKKSSKSG